MNPLSTTEKERIAELLGWERFGSDPDAYTWHLFISPDGETHDLGRGSLTLEACMEYAKSKGWNYSIDAYFEERCIDAAVHLPGRTSTAAHPTDPLTAFVRALLAAEEVQS